MTRSSPSIRRSLSTIPINSLLNILLQPCSINGRSRLGHAFQQPTTTTTTTTTAAAAQSLRPFSSTSTNLSIKHTLINKHASIPPYPHGPARWYRQSDMGLYGGQRVQSGNHVAESKAKVRRVWRPNLQRKRLWSEALAASVQLTVTTRVLRTIDKVGGLDEYLLGESATRVKELGMKGWELRWKLMQTPKVKKRFEMQREALGMERDIPVERLPLQKAFRKAIIKPPRAERAKKKGNGEK